MDLNLLYSRHQHALMQAAGATSRLTRTKRLAAAALIAHRIRTYQLGKGALAAEDWLPAMERQPASMHLGLSA